MYYLMFIVKTIDLKRLYVSLFLDKTLLMFIYFLFSCILL